MFTLTPPSALLQRRKRSPNTRVSSLAISKSNAFTYHSAVFFGSGDFRWMWLMRKPMDPAQPLAARRGIAHRRRDLADARIDASGARPAPFERRRGLARPAQRADDDVHRPERPEPIGHRFRLLEARAIESPVRRLRERRFGPCVSNEIEARHAGHGISGRARAGAPARPGPLSPRERVEELHEDAVERVGLVEIGRVARVLDHYEARAGDLLRHVLARR